MTVTIANLTSTWTDSNVSYNGIGLNVTGVGYNSNSKIFNVKFDGLTMFNVGANGNVYMPNTTSTLMANTVSANIVSPYISTNNFRANTVNVASRGITKDSLPSGSILQVVQTIKKDTWSSSNDGVSFYPVTGFTASITPTSTTSKILVMMSAHISTGYWEMQGRLTRDGSPITETYGDARSLRTRCSFVWNSYGGGTSGYSWMPVNYQFLDSPATTSAITYGLQLNGYSTYTIGFNYNVYSDNDSADYNGCPSSTLTLMEIAQ